MQCAFFHIDFHRRVNRCIFWVKKMSQNGLLRQFKYFMSKWCRKVTLNCFSDNYWLCGHKQSHLVPSCASCRQASLPTWKNSGPVQIRIGADPYKVFVNSLFRDHEACPWGTNLQQYWCWRTTHRWAESKFQAVNDYLGSGDVGLWILWPLRSESDIYLSLRYCIFGWEWLINIPSEVKHIWRKQLSLVSILYVGE